MRVFAVAFLALFGVVHWGDVPGDARDRPLSMFRDCEPAWVGDALFLLLMAAGIATARTAWLVQRRLDASVYVVATALLGVVAATPSLDSTHFLCSMLVLGIVQLHIAVLLFRAEELFWLAMHLATPTFLMLATKLESYGLWQKGMILYFLLAIVLHEYVMGQWLPGRTDSGRTFDEADRVHLDAAAYCDAQLMAPASPSAGSGSVAAGMPLGRPISRRIDYASHRRRIDHN